MNKFILLFALLLLPVTTVSFADDAQQMITLKDGSQIKGILSGINNGTYTIKTPIIGDVHVAASDVVSITNGSAPVAALPANNLSAPLSPSTLNLDQQVAAGQQQLISNPQSMATIQQMMQDPAIMQALQDPAVVQAVTNHDYQAVQNNPKIQALMSNPNMQALLQQLQGQQKSSSQ